jgi:hypothetical protein
MQQKEIPIAMGYTDVQLGRDTGVETMKQMHSSFQHPMLTNLWSKHVM